MGQRVIMGPAMGEAEIRDVLATPMPMDTAFFSIENQTIDALELTHEHLMRLPGRPLSWKWVVIGMHTALHGSFGLAIHGTTPAPLYVDWQEKQYWERVEIERETGVKQNFFTFTWTDAKTGKQREVEPQIDLFLNLYKKSRKADRMRHFGSRPLTPTSEQNESIKMLNSKRNDLVHFSTMSLGYDIPRLLKVIGHCVDVAHFLLTEALPFDAIDAPKEAARARELLKGIPIDLEAVRQRIEAGTS